MPALTEAERLALNEMFRLVRESTNRYFPEVRVGDLLQAASSVTGDFVNATGDAMTGALTITGSANTTQLAIRAASSQTDSNSSDIVRFFPFTGTDHSNSPGISPAGNLRFGYSGGQGITWRGAGLINQNSAYLYSPNGMILELSTGSGAGDNADKISMRLGAVEYARLHRPAGVVGFEVLAPVSTTSTVTGAAIQALGVNAVSNADINLLGVTGSSTSRIQWQRNGVKKWTLYSYADDGTFELYNESLGAALMQAGLAGGGIAFPHAGGVSVGERLVVPVKSDATRGAAGTAGRIIYNTTDSQLNIDTGAAWTLPDGTVT